MLGIIILIIMVTTIVMGSMWLGHENIDIFVNNKGVTIKVEQNQLIPLFYHVFYYDAKTKIWYPTVKKKKLNRKIYYFHNQAYRVAHKYNFNDFYVNYYKEIRLNHENI